MITRIIFSLLLCVASAAHAQRPGGTYHPPPIRVPPPPIIAPPPPVAVPQTQQPRACPQTCYYVYSNCQQPSCEVRCTTTC